MSQGPSWVAFTMLLLLPAGSLLQTTEAMRRLGAGGPPASEKLCPRGSILHTHSSRSHSHPFRTCPQSELCHPDPGAVGRSGGSAQGSGTRQLGLYAPIFPPVEWAQ